MRDYLPMLGTMPLFQGIEESELGQMLDCLGAISRRYEKGAAIFRAGDPATHLGVVLTGQVQVSREEADGTRQLLAAIGPGGLFGEAFACAGVEALPVTAAASARSRVLLLDRLRIVTPCSGACRFHQRIIANLMAVLARKNIYLAQNLAHVSQRTLREKLLSYLGEQAALAGGRSFAIPFDRQELADYLCADRSALSRELGKLRREGVLETQKNRFQLLKLNQTQ